MTAFTSWFALAAAFGAFALFSAAPLTAQISFEQSTWKAALDKAKNQNKLLFVDSYATWCGPCKWMDANVFKTKEAGDYFNANFVNLKLDMEGTDGKSFGMKYPVAAYPTFMFIDPHTGKVAHKVEGSRPVADFISEGKTAKGKFGGNGGGGNKTASDDGYKINFEKGTWSAAHQKASGKGQLLFVDAYATWCGPCKWMDKNVFTNSAAGDYFNANFVNLKLDMESADGTNFNKKYPVAAYPTFLFIDASGKVVHKVEGSRSAEEFIEEAKKAQEKHGKGGGNNKGGGKKDDDGDGGSTDDNNDNNNDDNNDQIDYSAEGKALAKSITDCLSAPLNKVFDKEVLDALEKMLTDPDNAEQMLEEMGEEFAERIATQLDEAATITSEQEGCMSSAIERVDALTEQYPDFDNMQLEEEILAQLKKQPKHRATYIWLSFMSAGGE